MRETHRRVGPARVFFQQRMEVEFGVNTDRVHGQRRRLVENEERVVLMHDAERRVDDEVVRVQTAFPPEETLGGKSRRKLRYGDRLSGDPRVTWQGRTRR